MGVELGRVTVRPKAADVLGRRPGAAGAVGRPGSPPLLGAGSATGEAPGAHENCVAGTEARYDGSKETPGRSRAPWTIRVDEWESRAGLAVSA